VSSRTDNPTISRKIKWDKTVAGVRPGDKRLLVAQASQKRVVGLEKPRRRKVGPAKKTANFLGCVTPDLSRDFRKYAHLVWKTKKKNIIIIKSWKELKDLLQQYIRIDKLALETHGSPGELTIGEINRLDEPKVTKLFSRNMPKIRELYFGGCNVGRNPVPLVTFGKLFYAKTITAWSLFHTIQEVFVEIERRLKDESEYKAIQDMYRGYWVGGTPDASKLSKLRRGRHRFLVEWFSQTPQWESSLPQHIHADDLIDKVHYISPADAEVWEIPPEKAQETAVKLEPTKEWAKLIKIVIKF
jgi:hypothetical protein